MWIPRRFFRNLCAYSFAVVLAFGFLLGLLGSFALACVMLFGPLAVAAAQEGQSCAARAQNYPDPTHMWKVARDMAEVYLTFLVIGSALLALSVGEIRLALAQSNILLIFSVFGVLTGIGFAVARWSYAFGVKLEMEHQDNNAG